QARNSRPQPLPGIEVRRNRAPPRLRNQHRQSPRPPRAAKTPRTLSGARKQSRGPIASPAPRINRFPASIRRGPRKKRNCQHPEECLPDYLQNALSQPKAAEVEQHCQNCASCAKDIVMWKKLAVLPEEKPGAESRQRFDAMLHAYATTAAEAAASVRA